MITVTEIEINNRNIPGQNLLKANSPEPLLRESGQYFLTPINFHGIDPIIFDFDFVAFENRDFGSINPEEGETELDFSARMECSGMKSEALLNLGCA
jgi:hypothetical protein